MADPFDLFGENDATKSSTIDDDFDALFGPMGGDSDSKDEKEREQDLDNLLKPTPSVSTEDPSKRGVTGETKTDPTGHSSSDNTLVDVGHVDGLTETSSTSNSATTTPSTNSKTLDKDKLFSLDDNDPGLQDCLCPSSSSNPAESSSFLDDNIQQPSITVNTPDTKRDIFEDVLVPKANDSTRKHEAIHSLDDIFASGSSEEPETEQSLTDLFGPKPPSANKRKSDALGDIAGQSSHADFKSLNRRDDDPEDIFMSRELRESKSCVGEIVSVASLSSTGVEKEPLTVGPEDEPDEIPDAGAIDGDTMTKDSQSLSADLFTDLPDITATALAKTPAILTASVVDGVKPSAAVTMSVDDHAAAVGVAACDSGATVDEIARGTRMDQEQEAVVTDDGMDKSRAVPDILDFLEDSCPDLPDVSTLESHSGRNTDQLDLISSHPGSNVGTCSEDDEGTSRSKRDHGADLEVVEREEDDVEPTQAKKKKEEENDRNAPSGNIKLSVTAPSFDLGGSSDPGEKDERVVETKSAAEQKDVEKDKKSKQLKDEIQKESKFMDFSVLEIPGDLQLNVDVSKHKRTLSKKGSLALRKRPSRRGIRSTGSDGDDALFQDSTEPKPPVVSDDEDDGKTDEKRQDMPARGDGEKASVLGDAGRGPSKPPMTGGVKIPGLLEGLKKSKSFKSPDLKKTNTSTIDSADTKKSPDKEEHNFRSLLKPTSSSSPLSLSSSSSSAAPSKSLKDSQNQSIAQTPPSIKLSDLRRQPMAGSIKLPALIKPSSPADRGTNKPQSSASKVPPPVASKPKPSLPSAKPRLSPVVKAEQPTNSITAATSSSSVSDQKKKGNEELQINSSLSSYVLEDSKKTETALSTSVTPSINTTPSPSTLKNSTSLPPATTTTSSPSNILSSIRPKPYTPPKPRPRPSPTTRSTPLPNSKPSSNTQKSDASDKEEEEYSINKSSTKDAEKTDLSQIPSSLITKPRTSSFSSSLESSQDATDSSVMKPRKSSISGVWAVQSPIGPDRSAPRKSSISGTAYAPMGFKRSISNEGSDKSDDKPECLLKDKDSTASDSKSRTSSIAESSEKEKDMERSEKNDSKTHETENSNEPIDKRITATDKDGIKPKDTSLTDNRMNEVNVEISNKSSSSSGMNGKPETPQKPMWGVQLRKVDRKPPTPSKPSIEPRQEIESPANWRQQLANKRKSITPKDPPSKEPEPNVPEWAKASIERRKRLMECGVIKSEAK